MYQIAFMFSDLTSFWVVTTILSLRESYVLSVYYHCVGLMFYHCTIIAESYHDIVTVRVVALKRAGGGSWLKRQSVRVMLVSWERCHCWAVELPNHADRWWS
jgi:hypothetical protein